MLGCSCLTGFCQRGGGQGGDGGQFLLGMFQSSMGIALHVISSSTGESLPMLELVLHPLEWEVRWGGWGWC